MKARTKADQGAAKTLCSPFDQPELPPGTLLLPISFLIYLVLSVNFFQFGGGLGGGGGLRFWGFNFSTPAEFQSTMDAELPNIGDFFCCFYKKDDKRHLFYLFPFIPYWK